MGFNYPVVLFFLIFCLPRESGDPVFGYFVASPAVCPLCICYTSIHCHFERAPHRRRDEKSGFLSLESTPKRKISLYVRNDNQEIIIDIQIPIFTTCIFRKGETQSAQYTRFPQLKNAPIHHRHSPPRKSLNYRYIFDRLHG